jgi:hypothetical protein
MAEHENCVGESDDWFTPKKYFDAIGLEFDLDPAHPGLGTKHCHVPVRRVSRPQTTGCSARGGVASSLSTRLTVRATNTSPG